MLQNVMKKNIKNKKPGNKLSTVKNVKIDKNEIRYNLKII